jgi:hypothetical protein
MVGKTLIGSKHVVQAENHQMYQKLFPLYEQVYDQLRETFNEIASFQNGYEEGHDEFI